MEGEQDLWELKDRLGAADFWVSEVVNHGFIHPIYFFDPNNIPIEFSAPVRGVDIRKTLKMKDKNPSAVAREGPELQRGIWPEGVSPTPPEDRMVYPGEGMILTTNGDEES